jgi:ribose transport system permease protein
MTRRFKPPRELPVLAIVTIACLVLAARDQYLQVVLKQSPVFLTSSNLTTLAKETAVIGIMACGEGLVILSGGLDLSIASTLALSSCVAAGCMAAGWPWPIAVLAGMLAAGAGGLLNGALVTYRKLPPILTTLATLLLFRYGTSIATHARNYGPFPDAFNLLATNWNPLLILMVVGLLFTLLTVRAPLGRWLTAMGGNEQAALLSGVPTERIKRIAYLLSGLCAGLAGLIAMAYNNNTQSNVAPGYELTVVAACVVGGVAITGGEGTLPGAVLGALLIELVQDALILMKLPTELQGLLTGGVVLVAAVLERWRKVRQNRTARVQA